MLSGVSGKKSAWMGLVLIIIVVVFLHTGIILHYPQFCRVNVPAADLFGRSPVKDKNKLSSGYTLLAPFNRLNPSLDQSGKVYLVDLYGKPVQIWDTQFQP